MIRAPARDSIEFLFPVSRFFFSSTFLFLFLFLLLLCSIPIPLSPITLSTGATGVGAIRGIGAVPGSGNFYARQKLEGRGRGGILGTPGSVATREIAGVERERGSLPSIFNVSELGGNPLSALIIGR